MLEIVLRKTMLKWTVSISKGEKMTQTLKISHRFASDLNFHLRILQFFKLKKGMAYDFRQW